MDKATEGYGRPFVARTENDALRVIQKEVNRNDPDNMLYTNTGDFSLWHVGNWEDETGEVTGLGKPRRLIECSTLKLA